MTDGNRQYLFIIRHGDRWDYSTPEWKLLETSRTGDSPLSTLGHQQAQEVGKFLDTWLTEKQLDDVVWMSSPFLRCLQTSNDALNAMRTFSKAPTMPILPEYSIFEWDGNGGTWHKDLPPLVERKHYFPRLDMNYKTFFVPALPEPRRDFFARCQRSVDCLHGRFPHKPGQVLVAVSHAAGCIALARTLTKLTLQDITPAGPCSIFGLWRESDTDVWTIDPHDKPGGLNGYTDHLSERGSTTRPWNNFGNGTEKFYTGPPTSRFATLQEEVIDNGTAK
jgi:broad specificity phosphatase PhoE